MDSQIKIPSVSIICAWFNRPEYIDQTLLSLLNQDFKDYEIIIVNDGSTDSRVKEKLDSFDDPKLRIIHQENIGFTNSINKGIEISQAPYICVMGAGDVVEKDKIRKQFDYMERNKHVSAVGTGHQLVSTLNSNNKMYISPCTKTTVDILKKRTPFTHGTVMYRTSDLIAVNKYDAFFECCQDWELYFRLLKVGEIHAIDEDLYAKFIFEDGVTYSPEKKIKQRFYKKLAVNQNLELIEEYKKGKKDYSDKIDPVSYKNIIYTLRMIRVFFRDKEKALMYLWLKLLLKQLKILS